MIITNNIQRDAGGGRSGFFWGAGDRPIEGYTVRRGLGIGGFGEVYFATTDAGKEVAIKRITRNAKIEVRGTKHCLNLRHPNLVQLYDVRQIDDDQAWIVMEYIAGQTLRELIDANPSGVDVALSLDLFGQLAAGVAYLHSQGIVHRDLKPANIFLEGGFVKIGDYGLSKFISASKRAGQTDSVGTFHYMAPEIARGNYGKEIDIYALGVILYELLTGRVPFDGESVQEIIVKHMTDAPDVRELPQPYANVIERALAKDPAHRQPDVASLMLELGRPIPGATVDYGTVQGNVDIGASPKPGQQAYPGKPVALPPPLKFRFEEPIAAAVTKTWGDLMQWWKRIDNSFPKMAVLVCIAMLMYQSAGVWASVAYWAALVYPTYYGIRYWFASRRFHRQQAMYATIPVTPRQEDIPSVPTEDKMTLRYGATLPPPVPLQPQYAEPVRLPFKKWQAAQRHVLAQRSVAERMREWTGSVVAAGVSTAVIAVLGSLAALASGSIETRMLLPVVVWLSATVWVAATTILLLSKIWEGRPEDGISYRFTQLAFGLAVGLFAFGIDQYLAVPWNDVYRSAVLQDAQATNDAVATHVRDNHNLFPGFFESAKPLLPAYLAYFALLFGGIRWWRLGDRLRRNRFSIAAVVFAVVLSLIFTSFVYFPRPWAAGITGAMAVILQISAYFTGWSKHQIYLKPVAMPGQ